PSTEVFESALGLSESVLLTGYVKDLAAVYDRCRVFVVPHRYAAGIPLKAIEAMSHGVPCVMTRLLADQLEVTDGVEALVANDNQEFIDKVVRLYQDRELWHSVRQRALDFLGGRYDPAAMTETLRQCLEAAVAKKAGAGALRPLPNGATRA